MVLLRVVASSIKCPMRMAREMPRTSTRPCHSSVNVHRYGCGPLSIVPLALSSAGEFTPRKHKRYGGPCSGWFSSSQFPPPTYGNNRSYVCKVNRPTEDAGPEALRKMPCSRAPVHGENDEWARRQAVPEHPGCPVVLSDPARLEGTSGTAPWSIHCRGPVEKSSVER